MRIAIVDDIKEERDKLADVLTKQLSRRGIHVNLFEFENGEDFLIAAKERPFTVVFLDIYMSGANGIETARELRIFDSDALLIFTTTSTDHSGKYIDIKVNGSNVQVPFRHIIYAEHFSHMIHIHTTGGKELITRQSFEAFTASLKMDSRFYLCSRGVVINLEHAVDFDGALFILDDETRISVSRKLVKNARQTFMDFLFQRGH